MRVQVKKVLLSEAKNFNGRDLMEWHLRVEDEHGESHLVGINSVPKNKYEEGQTFDMDIQYRDDGDPKVFKAGDEWLKVVKRARPGQFASPGNGVSSSPPASQPPHPSAVPRDATMTMAQLGELAMAAQFVALKMGLQADENTKADVTARIFNTLFIGADKLDVFSAAPPPQKPSNDPRPPEDTSVTDEIPF